MCPSFPVRGWAREEGRTRDQRRGLCWKDSQNGKAPSFAWFLGSLCSWQQDRDEARFPPKARLRAGIRRLIRESWPSSDHRPPERAADRGRVPERLRVRPGPGVTPARPRASPGATVGSGLRFPFSAHAARRLARKSTGCDAGPVPGRGEARTGCCSLDYLGNRRRAAGHS